MNQLGFAVVGVGKADQANAHTGVWATRLLFIQEFIDHLLEGLAGEQAGCSRATHARNRGLSLAHAIGRRKKLGGRRHDGGRVVHRRLLSIAETTVFASSYASRTSPVMG